MKPDKARILVVDDTPANLQLLGRILKRQGYDVRLAPKGQFAISSAMAEPPDLILLDIMMPGMDGYEVCEQLKADDRTRHVPVIFISALQDTLDKVKAFSLGGVDYISKPFQSKEVLARVQTHLNLRTLQSRLEKRNTELTSINEQLHREIRERQRAEHALKESEELHRITLSSISDALFITDDNGNITFMCPNVEVIFGYSTEEALIFKKLSDLLGDLTFDRHVLNTVGEIRNYEHEIIDKTGNPHDLLINIKSVSIKGGTLLFTCRDITERKAVEKELVKYQKKLRSLHSEMLVIEERERRKIALELHDDIGQKLALLKMKLGPLEEAVCACGVHELFHEVNNLTEQTIQTTRSLMFETSPSMLYELGFEAAIEWLIEEFHDQHGIRVDLRNDNISKMMDERSRFLLFRVTRELLLNIIKHAGTQQAKVVLSREDNNIRITVEDQGVGFDTSKLESFFITAKSFGLFSIRERLTDLGGEMDIKSAPGKGTTVTLLVPMVKQDIRPEKKEESREG